MAAAWQTIKMKKLINDWSVAPASIFIKKWEGCRLEAYTCSAGVATIGWGHTKDVKLGDTICLRKAEKYLLDDLVECQKGLASLVNVEVTESQFIALMSFVFNLGLGNFKSSTLRKKLNAGNFTGAQAEFERWVYAGGKVIQGIVNRRKEEAEFFGR